MCKNKYVYNWLWRPMSFLIFFSPSKFSLCGYNLTNIRTSLKGNRPFTLANTKKMMLLFLFLEVTKDIFYIPIWMYTYMKYLISKIKSKKPYLAKSWVVYFRNQIQNKYLFQTKKLRYTYKIDRRIYYWWADIFFCFGKEIKIYKIGEYIDISDTYLSTMLLGIRQFFATIKKGQKRKNRVINRKKFNDHTPFFSKNKC